MKNNKNTISQYRICTALPDVDSSPAQAAPTEIQIAPLGKFFYTNNGANEWVTLTEKDFASAVAAKDDLVNDLVIDYEHQTLTGEKAPASGWIKKLINKGKDGLWAVVEWTAKAAEHIAAREYRYISPVLMFDSAAANGKRYALRIGPVGLTNFPLIDGMAPLILKVLAHGVDSRESAETKPAALIVAAKEETNMNEKLKAFVIAMLGLAPDISDDDLAAAMEQATTAAKEKKEAAPPAACKGVCDALGLPEGASEVDVTGKILTLKATTVRADELTQAKAELAGFKAAQVVAKAESEGKIVPAMRPWADSMARKDPAAFEEWAKVAPVICKLGAEPAPKTPAKGDTAGDPLRVAIRKAAKISDARASELISGR